MEGRERNHLELAEFPGLDTNFSEAAARPAKVEDDNRPVSDYQENLNFGVYRVISDVVL